MKSKKKKLNKVSIIKSMSRFMFGQVKAVQTVPNKKNKKSKYPEKFDD